MNGQTNLVLDTNAVIELLRGDIALGKLISEASTIAISVISFIEFEAGANLTSSDSQLLNDLARAVEVVSIELNNRTMIDRIVSIRRDSRLKLPDAVIAAVTMERGAVLVTRDQHFGRVAGLITESF